MADNPGFRIEATSPNPRDDLLLVPYNMASMVPDKRPQVGDLNSAIRWEARAKPVPDQFSDWVLLLIEGGNAADSTLVFGQQITPSAALLTNPSDEYSDIDFWTWHNVLRKVGLLQYGSDGNLLDLIVTTDEDPEESLLTLITTDIWWTTEPWPLELLATDVPRPSRVFWAYPGGFRGERWCLHEDLITPSISGISSVFGSATDRGNVQSNFFRATNHRSREPYAVDKQSKIRGRYFLERRAYQVINDDNRPTVRPYSS